MTFRAWAGQSASNVLVVLGALCLVLSLTYAGYALLKTWLLEQDRYLVAHDLAPLSVPLMTWTPSPTPTATPTFTATPLPSATPEPTLTPLPSATPTPTYTPTSTPLPSPTPTPTLPPTPTPPPTPRPASPAVKIRIPTLDVNRSVIELPRTRDRSTGAWTWNTERLFRSGRKDLVGHSQGSANPGQEGNMILVGHNYGYGYNGVFVRLGRLKPGHKVQVVNKAGKTFTYRVTKVQRVKWRKKNFAELTLHLSFLSTGGSERLTLVSCGGANFEPFPERIYVVAEPIR